MEENHGRSDENNSPPSGVRIGSVLIRAIHLCAAAIILGGLYFDIAMRELHAALALASLSGGLLWGAEWYQRRELFREAAGWATILKLVLIGIAAAWSAALWPLMLGAFILACLSSHLPKRYRHYPVFVERITNR